jgi:hypothetical protein
MKLRCGLKANLPLSAAPGEPLVTTDSQEMYIGTGTGIKKVSDITISETEPAIADRLKLWLKPSTNVTYIFTGGIWQEVNTKSASTDFGEF